MTDPAALLAAYDKQVRAWIPAAEGVVVERDGPLIRVLGLDEGAFVTYTDLGGLTGTDLDALIARQRAAPPPVEWKLHGHDEPADLADRLRAAGFVAQERETVVAGPVAPLAAAPPLLPEGVRLREVSARADLDRVAGERTWLADGLAREMAADPQALTVVVAEAGDELVASAWVRFLTGTGFATLWGGSTVPQWRQRGIYRALVEYRARLAEARGYSLLQVDALDTSRPILLKLGFTALTTTTPYVFTP
jgi:GNAT superfamily N-acetyltransferase